MIKLHLPKTKVFGRKENMMEVIKLLAFAVLLCGIAAGSHRVGYVAGAVDAAIRRGTEASPVKTGGGRANAVCPSGVGGRGFGLAAKERDGREASTSKHPFSNRSRGSLRSGDTAGTGEEVAK